MGWLSWVVNTFRSEQNDGHFANIFKSFFRVFLLLSLLTFQQIMLYKTIIRTNDDQVRLLIFASPGHRAHTQIVLFSWYSFYKSHFEFTKSNPYLALAGELWDAHCDAFRESCSCYRADSRLSPANGRSSCKVTPSLIGCVEIYNQSWLYDWTALYVCVCVFQWSSRFAPSQWQTSLQVMPSLIGWAQT